MRVGVVPARSNATGKATMVTWWMVLLIVLGCNDKNLSNAFSPSRPTRRLATNPPSSLSNPGSISNHRYASSFGSSPTRLNWSPLDEQGPSNGGFGKVLMLTGTGVEVTRAILMGGMSTDELMNQFTDSLQHLFVIEDLLLWTPLFLTMGVVWEFLSNPPPNYRQDKEPYVRGHYDHEQAQAYYQRHPYLVLQRLAEVVKLSYRFILGLFVDKYITDQELKNRPKRAQELLELITELGPTAIKIGQALSVRPDLIPEEFSDALATLQDQVPPFESQKAQEILERELGAEKSRRIPSLKEGPIASASIGQVYKVVLDGKEMAIKVQRPNVLAEIALDLFLARAFAPIYQALTGTATDLPGLANEWGRGFIGELDYRLEARNTIQFNHDMKERNMNAICAPNVHTEYSTERILVTEWVDGTRIDQCEDASDIPRLCSVALNAYLVMLLELNSLHCDPHPGNLLRTKDGKLCILDFGMTLEIDPSLQYSLLEYVAHLTADDYDQLPDDLAKLGFLKEDKLEFARRSGVLEPLKYFLKQVGQGGGAQRFKERIMTEYREKYPGMTDEELRLAMRTEMQQHIESVAETESVSCGITMEVEELQRQNRDSFRVPEWFLYTSRAFLTLEGVSLQADPNYSLIKSCFPYVAKRLVGDDDPRAQSALRNMLYGVGDNIDVKRVSDLVDGFSSYTATTKSTNQKDATREQGQIVMKNDGTQRLAKPLGKKEKIQEAEATLTLAKDSADILLAPEGNLVQSMLVEEGVLAASANFKDELRKSVDGPQKLRESLPFGVGRILPPLPFEQHIKKQLEPFIEKSAKESNAQALAEKMLTLLPRQPGRVDISNARSVLVSTLREMEPEQAALLLKELRENTPKYAPLVGQLGGKFASTLLKTASTNIETTLQELDQAGLRTDGMLKATAKGLSSVAQRSASAFGGNRAKDRSNLPSNNGKSMALPQVVPVDMPQQPQNSTYF